MAAEISLMQSHLSYNKCVQSPDFPQLCTDPSGGDRGCLLIVPRLFPSDILPQTPPCMLCPATSLTHVTFSLKAAASPSISMAFFQLLHRLLYALLCSSFYVLSFCLFHVHMYSSTKNIPCLHSQTPGKTSGSSVACGLVLWGICRIDRGCLNNNKIKYF